MLGSFARRASAVGLIVLLHLGVFAHLRHELCAPEEHTSGAAAGVDLSTSAHHSHGTAAPDPEELGEGGTDEHQPGSHTVPCDFCCPHGQPQLSVAKATSRYFGAVVASATAQAPAELRLSRVPRLLPFPNPPPIPDLA